MQLLPQLQNYLRGSCGSQNNSHLQESRRHLAFVSAVKERQRSSVIHDVSRQAELRQTSTPFAAAAIGGPYERHTKAVNGVAT